MLRILILPVLIALVGTLASCRAGAIDPDRVVRYASSPPSYPFDEFEAKRPDGGTGTIMAGAAAVDISPYNYHVWISGFGAGRMARGVHDPIWARALFLDDGRRSLVFLSLDLTGLMAPDVDTIRGLITREHPERILIGSTHNHQAPDTMGYWGFGPGIPLENGVVEEYQQEMMHLAASAVNQAVESARPARIRLGSAEVPQGYSINLWFPDDPSKKDDEMTVLRAEDISSGQPIATMVNWAAHAEGMLSRWHEISAEFPGRFYDAMEPDGGVAVFFQGALGGMVTLKICSWPNQKKIRDPNERLAFNEELGRVLARTAREALAAGEMFEYGDLNIRQARVAVRIPVETFLIKTAGKLHVLRHADRVDPKNPVLQTEVNAVDLGPATIVTVPGEIFPSIGFSIKERMDDRYKFVLGLVSDEVGYLMTPEEFQDKTYKYERSVSPCEQAGAIVVQGAFDALDELVGPGG